ncbi:hypothetical protein F5878DRAFT_63651 [Lentinula raphanica]|uniref:Gelsolin-like domain-containing protein n=1 Tax=Lentinula raphanica TaxID=153919 RepID=A0AA38PL72_9AGAR|nr:hypothetical protein F5878DRAFT_63651 [Lentinula raphanica]
MASPSTPSRSRYSDLPKLDNADGAVDWARKVRALQQQVDADEEAEYKRLQEEIAASRMARKRRSRGGFTSPTSGEFASSQESLISGVSQKTTVSDLKSVVDRQQNQAEALRKLAGPSSPPSATDITSSIATARAWMSSTSSNAAASKPSGPMSLAAFMGGRATGPVLNKHAPQQDAHDPTQFNDRTRITAPHPVFGRGGVAMPGLASSNRFPRRNDEGTSAAVLSNSGSARTFPDVPSINYGTSTPSLPTTAPLVIRPRSASPTKSDERPVSPARSENQVRTISTPGAAITSPESNSVSSQQPEFRERTLSGTSRVFPPGNVRSLSAEKSHLLRESTSRDRTISTPTGSSQVVIETRKDTAPSLRRPVSTNFTPPPKAFAPASALSKSPTHKSPVVTPSLAKPIRPDPKLSPQTPHLTVSPNTSPAFLKPPVQKEPTPSLSRLQGRGFVQNIVKASHAQTPPSSTPSTPDRPPSATRKATVLERWQHNGSSSSTPSSSPPVTSPKPLAMRKSFTAESTVSLKSVTPEPRALSKPGRTLPLTSNNENEIDRPQRESQSALNPQSTGLGSATTLVVFKPPADEEELGSFGDVNELGVKHSTAIIPSHQKLPMATRKPLTHPTRERARKPKKFREPVVKTSESPSPSMTQRVVEPSHIATVPIESESPTTLESSKHVSVSRTSNSSGNVGRITDRWAEQAIIGIKPAISSRPPSTESEPPKSSGMVGRRALPGLTATPALPPLGLIPSPAKITSITRTESSEKSPVSPNPVSKYPFEPTRPTTPGRHSRIPSTGNRATVMDVAQAFAEPDQKVTGLPEQTISHSSPIEEPESLPSHLNVRQNVSAPMLAERRRSSYQEKYAAITLPPLREEVTPASTPAGTLARDVSPVVQSLENTANGKKAQHEVEPSLARTASTDSDTIMIDHEDTPLPEINIDSLLASHQRSKSNTDLTAVSVEVMVITGNNATAISKETDVFYDVEVVAIVHRTKSKSSGLVSTAVWGWFGKHCEATDVEQRKLEELAKRYGTTVITVEQYTEPLDMLRALGNRLVVRQGKRVHWSADNTAMHIVRSRKGVIFIDELELKVQNLCSGFSYCLTVLETVYVWYGLGSVASERKAALAYGRSLGENVIELQEGQNDGDEMFWMILGDDAFANAHYWHWRPSAADINPRIWKVSENTVEAVDFVKAIPTMVHLVDCVWEFFVIIGSEARAQRQTIRTALHVASKLSQRVAWRRPYTPPVHVIVLPSQIPLDLKLHLRELDESLINPQGIPEHMNLLTIHQAHDHIQRTYWDKSVLKDPLMLPLGIHPGLIN